MKRYKVPAYDETTGKGLIRHVYVRVNRAGESPLLRGGKRAAGSPGTGTGGAGPLAAPLTVGVVLNTNYPAGQCGFGREVPHDLGPGLLMDTLLRARSKPVGAPRSIIR